MRRKSSLDLGVSQHAGRQHLRLLDVSSPAVKAARTSRCSGQIAQERAGAANELVDGRGLSGRPWQVVSAGQMSGPGFQMLAAQVGVGTSQWVSSQARIAVRDSGAPRMV